MRRLMYQECDILTAEELRMSRFGANLTILREKMGLTQDDFAKKIKISRQQISRWEIGASRPRSKQLKTIADFFKIDPDKFFFPVFDSKNLIRVLGYVPAGTAAVVSDSEDDEFIDAGSLNPESHFALRIKGTSMEPDYQEGDIVIFERASPAAALPPKQTDARTPYTRFTPYLGCICAVLLDGNETTIKRLEMTKTGSSQTEYTLVLRPLNPNHQSVAIGPKNSCAIQGEAIRLVREIGARRASR